MEVEDYRPQPGRVPSTDLLPHTTHQPHRELGGKSKTREGDVPIHGNTAISTRLERVEGGDEEHQSKKV
jgi:hypothetical protein